MELDGSNRGRRCCYGWEIVSTVSSGLWDRQVPMGIGTSTLHSSNSEGRMKLSVVCLAIDDLKIRSANGKGMGWYGCLCVFVIIWCQE